MFVDKISVDAHVGGYLADLPVVRSLVASPLELTRPIMAISGENGSGKSTLVEAIAVAAGANPEGGSRNARFSSVEDPVSDLWRALALRRPRNPRDVFFLRGETYSGLAGYYETLVDEPFANLNQLSHGQGLLRILRERLSPETLVLLDEPEDGLSVFAQLELLGILWHLAGRGAQVIMSTHSPVLLGIPGAQLFEMTGDGLSPVMYDESEAVRAWEDFTSDPRGTADYLVQQ